LFCCSVGLAATSSHATPPSDEVANHHESGGAEIKREIEDEEEAEYPEEDYYENFIGGGDGNLGKEEEEEEEEESDEETICESDDAERGDAERGDADRTNADRGDADMNNECGLDLTTRRRSIDLDNGALYEQQRTDRVEGDSRGNEGEDKRTTDNINGGGRLVFTIKKEKDGTGYSIDNSSDFWKEQLSGVSVNQVSDGKIRCVSSSGSKGPCDLDSAIDRAAQTAAEMMMPRDPGIELPLRVRVLRDSSENERVLVNGEDVVPWCERALRASRTSSYGVGGENPRDFSGWCGVCSRTITGRYKYRIHMQVILDCCYCFYYQ